MDRGLVSQERSVSIARTADLVTSPVGEPRERKDESRLQPEHYYVLARFRAGVATGPEREAVEAWIAHDLEARAFVEVIDGIAEDFDGSWNAFLNPVMTSTSRESVGSAGPKSATISALRVWIPGAFRFEIEQSLFAGSLRLLPHFAGTARITGENDPSVRLWVTLNDSVVMAIDAGASEAEADESCDVSGASLLLWDLGVARRAEVRIKRRDATVSKTKFETVLGADYALCELGHEVAKVEIRVCKEGG